MARYRVDGPWATERTAPAALIETATLVDTRDGHRYTRGAFRVRVLTRGLTDRRGTPFRTRTFKGETAYDGAHAYFDDIMWAAARD